MKLLNDPDVVGHFTKGEVINKKWVKERVLEVVKDFQSVSEWKIKSPGSYKAARADGYFEEIKSQMNPPPREPKWNLESIAADAQKYSTKPE